MEKWEKTIFWIIAVTIGILLIGSLLGFDFRGLIGAVVAIDILLILDTAFSDMKNKWKAFGLKILILFVIIFVAGILFNISSESGGNLLGIIILLEFIQTISKKKEKHSKKSK